MGKKMKTDLSLLTSTIDKWTQRAFFEGFYSFTVYSVQYIFDIMLYKLYVDKGKILMNFQQARAYAYPSDHKSIINISLIIYM